MPTRPDVLIIRPVHAPPAVLYACDVAVRQFGAIVLAVSDVHPVTLLRTASRFRPHVRGAGVVHAFGAPALACAITAGADRIVYTPLRWPNPHAIAWLRAAMQFRRIDILCSSETLRRALVARGVPLHRTHLVRPGVDVAEVPMERNDALRARLGLPPEARVVFAPGAITPASGHDTAMWGLSIANIVDPRYRLIIQTAAVGTAASVAQRVLDPAMLIDASTLAPEVSPSSLHAAADVVLFAPSGPIEPLDVVTAMACGQPIIASTTPQLIELLVDRETALLLSSRTPRGIAQRLDDLFADPDLRLNLPGRARSAVAEGLAQSQMKAALEGVYQASGATQTA